MSAKKSASPTPKAWANLQISFGLVTIPFAIKPIAESGRGVSGKFVCPEHGPTLQQRYLCSAGTKQEHLLEQGGQITAYEHPEKAGTFIVVNPDVLTEIAEERSGSLEVERIVSTDEIDPIYYDKTYLCWPQAGGEEAFDLFTEVLRKDGKAAVSTVVLSKQTVTLIIRWSDVAGTLVAHTCRFHSDVRWNEIGLVASGAESRPAPKAPLLKLAREILATLDGKFEAGEVVDHYTPMLESAILAAAGGETFTAPEGAPVRAKGDNLLETLMASVEKKPAAKKPAAKRSRAKAA